jgi:curved DNA-binding protein CbpA
MPQLSADPYEILELLRQPLEESDDRGGWSLVDQAVREAYQTLASRYHPDKSSQFANASKFSEVATVYSLLRTMNDRVCIRQSFLPIGRTLASK